MVRKLLQRGLIAGMLAIILAAGATPPASAATNYTFTLVKLECVKKQDSWLNGNDEPRVIVNGDIIYLGSGYDTGDIRTLNIVALKTATTSFNIEVWENDAEPDNDDKIGEFSITPSAKAGLGVLNKQVTGSGGTYKIYYEVN